MSDSLGEVPPGRILHFPRRRGRPKTAVRPRRDSGTPELVMKRLLGETTEALDLCLERGIITQEQHWCGVHRRWLYTLRYGVPGVRAVDPTHFGGIEPKPEDPGWRAAREEEYHAALRRLADTGHAALLINLCVYNERPAFLKYNSSITLKRAQLLQSAIGKLREGFDILIGLWCQEAGQG